MLHHIFIILFAIYQVHNSLTARRKRHVSLKRPLKVLFLRFLHLCKKIYWHTFINVNSVSSSRLVPIGDFGRKLSLKVQIDAETKTLLFLIFPKLKWGPPSTNRHFNCLFLSWKVCIVLIWLNEFQLCWDFHLKIIIVPQHAMPVGWTWAFKRTLPNATFQSKIDDNV